MFQLLCLVVLLLFTASAVSGLVAFWSDIRNFKSDIEFSGTRKQLIEHLMLAPVESQPEEVNDNDDQISH